jgi:hypothetical protein
LETLLVMAQEKLGENDTNHTLTDRQGHPIHDNHKFPDMVHAFKPDPITNVQSMERFFDFVSLTPEATHMITFLFSPWGITRQLPANARLRGQYLQVGEPGRVSRPRQISLGTAEARDPESHAKRSE